MEASNTQLYKEKEQRTCRPCAFDKMEELVREMQDPDNGVPVRSQKVFLTLIPAAFMGYDLIEWLMERLNIEESVEAVHVANQLCQYGYFFPVNDSRTLTVKDDSSLYRFQTPYYWPWQHRQPDNVEYAIYLSKRTLRNKQRHGLEDYELTALNEMKKNLQNKWDVIQLQAGEQVKIAKDRKKSDKIVCDSQERAFWRVCRPPPNCPNSFDVLSLPSRAWLTRPPPRKRTLADVKREVEFLQNSLTRTRIKFSVAVENLTSYYKVYIEHDPMITQPQPSNPWITEDATFWQLNSPLVNVSTERRVKRWKISLEELMSDPSGLQEFTNYLKKEYCLENIRFWLAVKHLRHSSQTKIHEKVEEIFKEFLVSGAPSEINIDSKAKEKVHQAMKSPNRFIFDSAAEHVYTMLLKKDCYPRFIRSEHFQNLLTAGVQPLQKKRFFNFGGQGKKKAPVGAPLSVCSLQQQQHGHSGGLGTLGRRRGSERSLSGSAHELILCGVRDAAALPPQVSHSHSQSNLTDIPYRDATKTETVPQPTDDVCPWETAQTAVTPRQKSSTKARTHKSHQLFSVHPKSAASTLSLVKGSCQDSKQELNLFSSSSDVSVGVKEVSNQFYKCNSIFSVANTSYHSNYTHHHYFHDCHEQQYSGALSLNPDQTQTNFSIGSAQKISSKIQLSETSRASVSSCYFSSSHNSFDSSYNQRQQLRHQAASITEVLVTSPVNTIPQKILEDSLRLEEISLSIKAPLMGVTAIKDELPRNLTTVHNDIITCNLSMDSDCAVTNQPFQKTKGAIEVGESATIRLLSQHQHGDKQSPVEVKMLSKTPIAASVLQTQPVEKFEIDQEDKANAIVQVNTSESAIVTSDLISSKDQQDNNVNEVCPWEDEENCKVDAPYVKTYATLGYI